MEGETRLGCAGCAARTPAPLAALGVTSDRMPIRWAYLKRVLAGAIFGLYIANLLYFLNPQIDITPARLLAVTIVYGLICGLLFGSALWGLRLLRVKLFGRPETYRAHGFGFVVLAAFIAAAIYW